MEKRHTINDLIKESKEWWIPEFTNEDGSIDEAKKAQTIKNLEDNMSDGTIGVVEGLILLSLIGGLNEETLPTDLIETNVTCYPQWKTVQRAMNRRAFSVPMMGLLDSFVTEDFLESYYKKSISFDELIFRLAMLGRVPYADYLLMSPKQRRELGNKVDLFRVF